MFVYCTKNDTAGTHRIQTTKPVFEDLLLDPAGAEPAYSSFGIIKLIDFDELYGGNLLNDKLSDPFAAFDMYYFIGI